MKFREMLRKAGSVLCAAGLFALGFYWADSLLVNKTSIKKYDDFFREERDYDVLFFGSSHVINGVSPLDLFHDYGITSYNLSMHGNYVSSSYYLMEEVLDFLKKESRMLPKAVVVDVYAGDEGISNLHNAWDSFPLSENKWEMAKSMAEEKDQAALLVPFFLYHNRWTELKKDDFQPDINLWYGVEPRYGVSYPAEGIITDPTDRKEIDEEKKDYLDKICKLCDSMGIQLILINIPYSYNPDWQREANQIGYYAKEQGIFYENYMNQDVGLDFDIDFYDQGHLNPVGMRRMTQELGMLLSEMGLKDHRGESGAQEWEQDYKEFLEFRIKRLGQVNEGKQYLMCLNDPELISEIWLNESVLEDVQTAKLVERLKKEGNRLHVEKGQVEITGEDGKMKEYDLYAVVHKRSGSGEEVHKAGFGYTESFQKTP